MSLNLTGNEISFPENELIVSKTDLKGKITYANDVFLSVSGYEEKELIGTPHNILRHPEMPHVVFKLLWDTLKAGKEIFAYVINRAKNGDHYWVLAHVTPWINENGDTKGYHSSRRVPKKEIVENVIKPLYLQLSKEEAKHSNVKEGMKAAEALLVNTIEQSPYHSYEELIHNTIWSTEDQEEA
ncbi:Chemotaxis sensory transducer [Candidatus Terasakiella magnetica]|uniref:Chemotaxis sensory transducer n=1 Tax=Candidatus Terasakiella magnetica TaxID=1867952 RepID=A0A1C3RFU4_9PROT|nr:PAS domain-containing protein [Candidatus Terasakiella magnetica]SCA56125.1 Chemotaxis sensory transducer [Candidatus Terasakiella magnetica]